MAANEPARTLMAHLGKDSYSHIHYDSAQQRVISVREAARLQSFPDGFRFAGTMNPAFRQIGNSVPPLLAWHIADELLRRLNITPNAPPDLSEEPRRTQARTRVA
jgi:DNA (cytosine-5)-methyltransferase 1